MEKVTVVGNQGDSSAYDKEARLLEEAIEAETCTRKKRHHRSMFMKGVQGKC